MRCSCAGIGGVQSVPQAGGIGWRAQQIGRLHDAVVVLQRHHDHGRRLLTGDDDRLVVVADAIHGVRKVLAGLGIGNGLRHTTSFFLYKNTYNIVQSQGRESFSSFSIRAMD